MNAQGQPEPTIKNDLPEGLKQTAKWALEVSGALKAVKEAAAKTKRQTND
jgi:hypothetical protein